MTDPVEPRTRKGGPVHNATHLHALWMREEVNVLAAAASTFMVAEIADGLACFSEGREVGRVTVRDGVVIASPPHSGPAPSSPTASSPRN